MTTPDYAGLAQKLHYRVENPSAWSEGFDQEASDLMKEATTALRTLLESKAVLERDHLTDMIQTWQNRWSQTDIARLKAEAERDRLSERVAELEGALEEIRRLDRVTRNRGTENQSYEDGPCGQIAARSLVKGGGDGE